MPPARTIHTDPRVVLRGIAAASNELIEELDQAGRFGRLDRSWCHKRDPASVRDRWTAYDIAAWTGRRDLSESEAQRWRREVRQLGADGHIEIDARSVRLTESGKQLVGSIGPPIK